MAIALNTVIVDGQEYKPGDVIPDFKSIKCVDTREPRKYQGLSADVSVLNDVIAKYASGGASCFMSDTGEYYEYDREEKTWKLITNITERGFDSEKAYGALRHMLNLKNEVIDTSVKSWLDNHPEATTTVQNGAITESKIYPDFLPYIKKDYVTPEMFGAVGDGVTDDTNAFNKALSKNGTLFLSKKYAISDVDITSKVICGNNSVIIPKGECAFLVTSTEEITVISGCVFMCDIVDAIKINCELTDDNETITTKDTRGQTIENCFFISQNVRSEAVGITIVGAVETCVKNCKAYGCGLALVDSSINVTISECVANRSKKGIQYGASGNFAEDKAFTAGLKILSTTILGCEYGIYCNNYDNLILDGCMIDYNDYSIYSTNGINPIISNCYISAYIRCVYFKNTREIQMSNCKILSHNREDTQTVPLLIDGIEKSFFSSIRFETECENIINVLGTNLETIFTSIYVSSSVPCELFSRGLNSSNVITNLFSGNSNLSFTEKGTMQIGFVETANASSLYTFKTILQGDGSRTIFEYTIPTIGKKGFKDGVIVFVQNYSKNYSATLNGKIVRIEFEEAPDKNLGVTGILI